MGKDSTLMELQVLACRVGEFLCDLQRRNEESKEQTLVRKNRKFAWSCSGRPEDAYFCLLRIVTVPWTSSPQLLAGNPPKRLAKIERLQVLLALSLEVLQFGLLFQSGNCGRQGSQDSMVELCQLLLAFRSENRHVLNALLTASKGSSFHCYMSGYITHYAAWLLYQEWKQQESWYEES